MSVIIPLKRPLACSRIATGGLSAKDLAAFHDTNGTNFKDAATAGGFPAASYEVDCPPPLRTPTSPPFRLLDPQASDVNLDRGLYRFFRCGWAKGGGGRSLSWLKVPIASLGRHPWMGRYCVGVPGKLSAGHGEGGGLRGAAH